MHALLQFFFQLKDDVADDNIIMKFLKVEDLSLAADSELMQAWKRLEERSSGPANQFENWQKAAGMTWNPYGLLSSAILERQGLLKPVATYCFDYMHCLCSHGVMNDAVYYVLESLHMTGYKVWEILRDWIKVWVLPHCHSSCKLQNLLDRKAVANHKKAKSFKCSASEMLTLYKPLQYFLQTLYVEQGTMVEQCSCFICWAEVLDYFCSIASLANPSPVKVKQLVEKAMQATIDAGFGPVMRPKHHWTLHFTHCLSRWKQLPSCWSLERKHKTPRKYGSLQYGLEAYDKGLLTGVAQEHLGVLHNKPELFQTGCSILDPKPVGKKMEQYLKANQWFVEGMAISNSSRLEFGSMCKAGDICFCRSNGNEGFPFACCEIKHFLVVAGMELCIVQMLDFQESRANSHASTWQIPAESLQLLDIRSLLQPVVCSYINSAKVICLTPAPLSQQS